MQLIVHFQIIAQHERAIDKGIVPVRVVKCGDPWLRDGYAALRRTTSTKPAGPAVPFRRGNEGGNFIRANYPASTSQTNWQYLFGPLLCGAFSYMLSQSHQTH